jgi:FKBP-type peptidyl-prolyl cis-trans isomerase FkpA
MRTFAPVACLLMAATLYSCNSGMKEFKTLPSGLKYKIVDDKKGDKKATVGSFVTMHVTTKIKDSVLFDSRKMNGDKAIETPVNPPAQAGDIMEAFPELTEGDSVVFQIPIDTLAKGQPLPPFAKSGDLLSFHVRIVSVQSKEEYEKSKAEASKKQLESDDKAIQDYLKANNLNATKTASGLYYIITSPGSGANAAAGQEITMNYTGTLMNGQKFDSNEDPAFKHVEPFTFKLGQGQVIPGWEEGIALMNKGAKAKLIIPSTLAYGAQAMPGNESNPQGIPANSCLIFDVELKNLK